MNGGIMVRFLALALSVTLVGCFGASTAEREATDESSLDSTRVVVGVTGQGDDDDERETSGSPFLVGAPHPSTARTGPSPDPWANGETEDRGGGEGQGPSPDPWAASGPAPAPQGNGGKP